MKLTAIKLLALPALAICLTLLAGCQPSGIVMSAEEDKITIADRAGENAKTYEVAPDAKIVLDGKEAKLEELRPGDTVNVEIKREGGQTVATEVTARSNGSEPSPAPPEGPATPAQPLLPPENQDLPVPEEGFPPATDPDDAPADDPAQEGEPTPPAEEQPENAEDPAPPSDAGEDSQAANVRTWEGEIVSVDQARLMLQVGDEQRILQVPVTATILIDGQVATLEDLEPGQAASVTAEPHPEGFIARVVDATSK